ncbi:TPA: hypothetical protein P0E23_002812 [Vibrio harveyi]|uniref:hypothetical protein n=1 Tax=Vibrio sp. Y29_XK_CS5 TaxID=2957762 RepID=UPI0020A37C1C|nr:hypothetical protein [Vibrio sp. Y29_XK_CS5]HDM8170192.1 hypothetical protein [Vibrio harveyi]
MFIENKIKNFEKEICQILAQLAFHIHPKVVERIQRKNQEEFRYFRELFDGKIDVNDYLFDGSACVFPGVKRYVSGQGKKRAFNPEYSAIIDDNTFPRHLWCFLENGRTYNGPSWQKSGLNQFELAHIFTHKSSELDLERAFFDTVNDDLRPFGDFSCAGNITLLPKGTVRPTDNSPAIKAVFYQRFISLYGESLLNGRSGFKAELVPDWYPTLRWNEPPLPYEWERRTDLLLAYRTKRVTEIMTKLV